MPEEKQFYSDSTVTITSTRAILSGKTYAMANITSVATYIEPPNIGAAFLLASVGGIAIWLSGLLEASGGQLIGAVFIIIGVAILFMPKTYWVRIGSASAESNALSSKDKTYIDKIVAAMNNAIVHRG